MTRGREVVLVLSLLLSGCKLVSAAAAAPARVMGGKPARPVVDPVVLEADVRRMADGLIARVGDATRVFAERVGTPEARIQGLEWWIASSTQVLAIASGPLPVANAVDMLVLVSLSRAVHEQYWQPQVWGETDRPMIEAFTHLETSAWELVAKVFDARQQEELRGLIHKWLEENRDLHVVALESVPRFAELSRSQKKEGGVPIVGEIVDLVSLDPFAGLDPTVRQFEEGRRFAERALFYAQRMPILVSAQAELLALQISRMPLVESFRSDSARVSQAAESLATTAAALPDSVRVEREATIAQISGELAAQRRGLVADLEAAREPLQSLLAESRATLEAGRDMASAIDAAVKSLDTFVGRFGGPEEPEEPEEPPSPAGRPFDITEYGATAADIGNAAHELTAAIVALDQSLPQVQRILDEAARRGEQSIDHAFERALWLGAFAIGGVAAATLFVRWVTPRLPRGASGAS